MLGTIEIYGMICGLQQGVQRNFNIIKQEIPLLLGGGMNCPSLCLALIRTYK